MKTWLSGVGSRKSFQIAHRLTEFVALFLGLFRLILLYCFIFVVFFLPPEQFHILAYFASLWLLVIWVTFWKFSRELGEHHNFPEGFLSDQNPLPLESFRGGCMDILYVRKLLLTKQVCTDGYFVQGLGTDQGASLRSVQRQRAKKPCDTDQSSLVNKYSML